MTHLENTNAVRRLDGSITKLEEGVMGAGIGGVVGGTIGTAAASIKANIEASKLKSASDLRHATAVMNGAKSDYVVNQNKQTKLKYAVSKVKLEKAYSEFEKDSRKIFDKYALKWTGIGAVIGAVVGGLAIPD